jgi:predicted RNA-binding protein with PUA-like domain
VGLDEIKADSALKSMPLLKNSRLSVMPLTKEQFDRVLQLGGEPVKQAP